MLSEAVNHTADAGHAYYGPEDFKVDIFIRARDGKGEHEQWLLCKESFRNRAHLIMRHGPHR